jgi:hypothetical protein
MRIKITPVSDSVYDSVRDSVRDRAQGMEKASVRESL